MFLGIPDSLLNILIEKLVLTVVLAVDKGGDRGW